MSTTDRLLVRQIRAGDEAAWKSCIDQYEGRLYAFVVSRLHDRALAEDVVQETFVGFLTSLPNFDETRPIEAFLFRIAANKLTDALRRSGRRPALPLMDGDGSAYGSELVGSARKASSLARSRERQETEERVVAACLSELIRSWRESGYHERLKCIELLYVAGWANRDVAAHLAISEQDVANHKSYVMKQLRAAVETKMSGPVALVDLE